VWLVRAIALMAVMIVFLWFAYLNLDEKVTITFFAERSVLRDVPLFIALLASFAIGVFTWFIVSLFQDFRMRAELRRARKEAHRLREELTALRNIPVRDIEESSEQLEAEESVS
jgi:uncharacterized integral membrane protein